MTINPLFLWFLCAGCTGFGYILGALMTRASLATWHKDVDEILTEFQRYLNRERSRLVHDVPIWETPVRWLNEEEK